MSAKSCTDDVLNRNWSEISVIETTARDIAAGARRRNDAFTEESTSLDLEYAPNVAILLGELPILVSYVILHVLALAGLLASLLTAVTFCSLR